MRMHPATLVELKALWKAPTRGGYMIDVGGTLFGIPIESDQSLAEFEVRYEVSAPIAVWSE
jgi:hypothetical protein